MGFSGFLTPLFGYVRAEARGTEATARGLYERGTDVPTTQVELDYGKEPLDWIVYGWDVQQHLGMAHEAERDG